MHVVRNGFSRVTTSLAVASLLMATAGCHSKTAATPENFTAALNAHFLEHADCLFPESPRFPYATGDPAKVKQMNTLVTSQLLTVEVERDIQVSRYTPTKTGERSAPRFCYGHRVVSSIDSSTPAVVANGFPETQVVYHYTMTDVPVWAQSANVQAAFPAMALNISGTATDKATLARSAVDWQVPE